MATETALAPTLPDAQNLPADRHPAKVYLTSLGRGSEPAQRSALNKIAEPFGKDYASMNWAALRYQHVQFIRARLAEAYDANTANRMLTALRRVLRQCWKLDYLPDAEYHKLADIERIPSRRGDDEAELAGRALTIGEVTAIMAACAADKTAAGRRDSAVIALAFGLGLRRVEIIRAQVKDYRPEKKTLVVKHGKGNKTRTLPIDDGAKDALDDWLLTRGDRPGALFLGVNKGGRISSSRLSSRAVHELFRKRTIEAGVDAAAFHDLRRTFITTLLDQGVDLVTVAKLAGHSDPETTARYDRRKLDTRRKALAGLHVPFKRPKATAAKP